MFARGTTIVRLLESNDETPRKDGDDGVLPPIKISSYPSVFVFRLIIFLATAFLRKVKNNTYRRLFEMSRRDFGRRSRCNRVMCKHDGGARVRRFRVGRPRVGCDDAQYNNTKCAIRVNI